MVAHRLGSIIKPARSAYGRLLRKAGSTEQGGGLKTSELIRELTQVIAEHGDLPAYYFDGACKHEPDVFVGLHRTGNSTNIWELIGPPLSEEQASEILRGAPADVADWARTQFAGGTVIQRAALVKVRGESIKKARTVLAMYGQDSGACENCGAARGLLKETVLALTLARQTLGVLAKSVHVEQSLKTQLAETIQRAEKFLEGRDNA